MGGTGKMNAFPPVNSKYNPTIYGIPRVVLANHYISRENRCVGRPIYRRPGSGSFDRSIGGGVRSGTIPGAISEPIF